MMGELGLRVDLDRNRLIAHGDYVQVRPRVAEVVSIFLTNPGKVWSKEQLAFRLFGAGADYDPRTLEVHLSFARKALFQLGYKLINYTNRGWELVKIDAGGVDAT